MRVTGHGMSVDVPAGWEVRIFQRREGGPVMHLATFALGDGDGDFGAAATGRMRADDMFAALIEFRVDDRIHPGRGLFAAYGIPADAKPHEFSPRQLQVTRPGHLGRQRFFTYARQPYCLYLVLRPGHKRAGQLAGELTRVLRTVRLAEEG